MVPEIMFDLSCRLFGAATLQQSAEMLALTRAFERVGLWRTDGPALSLASSRVQFLLQGIRLVLGGALLIAGPSMALPVVLLFGFLGHFPTRGPMNGGSDAMTTTLGVGLSVSWLGFAGGLGVPRLGTMGLYFIGVHAILSYFVAGFVKCKEPEWWDGTAVRRALELPRYGLGRIRARWLTGPRLMRWLGRAIVLFECAFPLILLGPPVAAVLLSLGILFHWGNAWLLGLQRFWPVWLATYPAVLLLAEVGRNVQP